MKFKMKKIEFNWYILVAFVLGLLAIVLYFFPFFSYKSPSQVEDQYYYSGFEMTQALFWKEKDLDITDPSYQEKWLIIQLKQEDGIKGAMIATMIFTLLGLISTIVTLLLLLFEKGKWAEIGTSIFSTICFTIMVVLVQQICTELTNLYDIAFIENGSRMTVVWGLYTVLVVNALFTVTNLLRHDKKVIRYQEKLKERKNQSI